MSLDKFLSNLDKQDKDTKEKLKHAEEQRKKKEEENEDFRKGFDSFYTSNVLKDLEKIKDKLKDKFEVKFDKQTRLQQHNVYEAEMTIEPKFESATKSVSVKVIGECDRRLVTIAGSAPQTRYDGVVAFQDKFERFIETDIESEITKILEKYFINK